MKQPSEQALRVVVYRDEDVFIAQCLELDVAAHGDSPDAALRAFDLALVRHQAVARHMGTEAFGNVGPAPRAFFEMWDRLCAQGHERRPVLLTDALMAEPLPPLMHRAEAICA